MKSKPLAAIVLGGHPMGHEYDEKDGGEDYKSAGEDLIVAIKEGNAEKFSKFLKSFVEMCVHEYMEKKDDEGDPRTRGNENA